MIICIFLFFVFLLGMAAISGLTTALHTLGKWRCRHEYPQNYPFFFFQPILTRLFPDKEWEGLFFNTSSTKLLLILCYSFTSFFYLMKKRGTEDLFMLLMSYLVVILIAFFIDVSMRLWATAHPKTVLKSFSFIASIFLTLSLPINFIFNEIQSFFIQRAIRLKSHAPSFNVKDQILEMIYDTDLKSYLDPQDQKLIASMASFRERIVREIMVPRIDIFSLDANLNLKEVIPFLLKEEYSRIPVYETNVDHIIGVLHYKDALGLAVKSMTDPGASKLLETPIKSLLKPVLYAPETKKISQLLQEFRIKQIHLAIVVDEYGGTEGIVTIEDILEELVGEIADEYDIGEEHLFMPTPGGWIVDARMNILDIEEELNIKIPPSPEYDTIGGYIFHQAGTIPSKGWRMDHDDFELEILSSDERSIDKVKIIPRTAPPSEGV